MGSRVTSSRLGQLRTAAGFKQSDVAEYIGRSSISISDWERGEYLPSDAMLAELARLYGVTVERVRKAAEYDGREYARRLRASRVATGQKFPLDSKPDQGVDC